MADETLTVAILGLGKDGQRFLGAAREAGGFQIKAVADQDQQRAERAGAEYQCEPYTDYRQLIVQNQVDCLFVAADIHLCEDHLKTAIKKRFNVLKLAPPARDFEEALECVRLAEAEQTGFAIANPARFRSSYQKARALLSQGQPAQPFLVTAEGTVSGSARPAWYTDPKLAGGGVLLHDCYHIVDQILWNFPIPQQVYALTTNQAPDKQQRLYLTEETAVVSLKFTDALTGNVVATRRSDASSSPMRLRIYGKDGVLTVGDDRVALSVSAAEQEQSWHYEESEQEIMARLLSSFAESVRAGGEHPLASSGAENLRNMALLESAYLSARTGFPEEPARILRITGNPSGTATSI
jgi:predicted dehydrogenase